MFSAAGIECEAAISIARICAHEKRPGASLTSRRRSKDIFFSRTGALMKASYYAVSTLGHRLNASVEAGHFSRGVVGMNDALLRGARN